MSRIKRSSFCAVPWPAQVKMFRTRTLIFAVVSIAGSNSFALDESAEAINTNSKLPPELTIPTAPTTLTSCQKLDYFFGIYDLDSRGFAETLKLCNEETNNANTTLGTSVLLKVYNEIKGEQCTFKDGMDIKLIDCVNSELGFKPPLTAEETKHHFGRNGTRALRFEDQECKSSEKLRKCVEDAFSVKHVAPELLKCKESIIRGFNITKKLCQQNEQKANVPDAKDSGMKSLPSDIFILGTAVMLIKLTLSII
ncbi:uncharacterized protein LOC134666323 [Cydia fagiglandana]|uniref:uncharacterized protein LOC134666323 n=1 Tax=Cydia fagiglandana TaxID=1458189 RepID=UPI002FEE5499